MKNVSSPIPGNKRAYDVKTFLSSRSDGVIVLAEMAVVLYEFTLPEWVGSAGATLSEHSDVTENSVVAAVIQRV